MIKEKFFSLSFEAITIFLIIFSPFFLGSVGLLAESVIQLFILILTVIFLGRLLVQPKIILPVSSYFLLAVLGIGLLQILPLPPAFLKIISPQTFALYQSYLPDLNIGCGLTLAFYPLRTGKEILRFICFFLLFFITLNMVKEKKQFQRLILTIIFFGIVLSFYGIIKKFFILEAEISHSFSTFGNRNNFSGYMIMVVSLAIGYALSCRERSKQFLFGLIAAFLSTSVLLSLSRAGTLSLIFSLFLMFLLNRKTIFSVKARWLFPTVFVLGAIFVFIAGLDPLKERFALFGSGFSGRMGIVKDSLGMVRDFPLWGIGWANFQYLFTSYKQFVTTIYQDPHYNYLHNDHLQLLVEIGFTGAFFYFYFLYRLFKDILREFAKRRDTFVKSIVSGGLAGTLGVFLHSFVDFNFHIPAILFLFWFILGLTYKCVYSHFEQPCRK